MKKMLILFLMGIVVVVTGCGPQTVRHEESITITVPLEFNKHMPYEADLIPRFVYAFDGVRNVSGYSSQQHIVLTKNDDLKVSEDIKAIIEAYENRSMITRKQAQAAENDVARLGGNEYPIATPSYEYWHVLFMEDGSRVSLEYRKFTSGNQDYYGWTYANGITIRMEIPLMVRAETKEQVETKVLYMIPLPYHVKYELSTNIDVKKILSNQDYVDNSSWYTFSYPEDLETTLTKEEKVAHMKAWYVEYCAGRDIDGDFFVTYLGVDFRINFDTSRYHKTLNKDADAFEIIFVGQSG